MTTAYGKAAGGFLMCRQQGLASISYRRHHHRREARCGTMPAHDPADTHRAAMLAKGICRHAPCQRCKASALDIRTSVISGNAFGLDAQASTSQANVRLEIADCTEVAMASYGSDVAALDLVRNGWTRCRQPMRAHETFAVA